MKETKRSIEEEKAKFIEKLIAKEKERVKRIERIREEKLFEGIISDTIKILKREEYTKKLSIIYDSKFKKVAFDYPEIITITYSDEQIFFGLKTLDTEILEKLYKESLPIVDRMVNKYYGNSFDAQDVFQTAVMILVEKINQGKINDDTNIGAYLYKIATFIWMNELRTGNRSKTFVYDRTGENYNIEGLGGVVMEYPEEFETVREMLGKMGKTCIRIIEEWLYKGDSWEVIAKELNYANAAVASNLKYKCMQKLKEDYKQRKINN